MSELFRAPKPPTACHVCGTGLPDEAHRAVEMQWPLPPVVCCPLIPPDHIVIGRTAVPIAKGGAN